MEKMLYTSNDYYQLIAQMCKKIADLSCNENNDIIVVCPDKFSFHIEKEILSHVSAYANVRVQGLNYLKNQLCGGNESITKIKQSTLVAKAIELCKGELKYFKVNNISHGLTQKVQTALNLLKSNEIDFESLDKNDGDEINYKFFDLKIIAQKYQQLLGDNLDQNDSFEKAIAIAKSKSYFSDKIVFVIGFDDLTKQALRLVEIIMQQANDVYFSATRPQPLQKNGYLFENGLISKICALSKDIKISESFAKNDIISNILTSQPLEMKSTFLLSTPENELVEAERVALEIYLLLRNGKYAPDDINIFCSDVTKYQDILLEQLQKYNIPNFIDCAQNISNCIYPTYLKLMLNFKKQNYPISFLLFLLNIMGQNGECKHLQNKLNEEGGLENLLKICQKYRKNSEIFEKIAEKLQNIEKNINNLDFLQLFDDDFLKYFQSKNGEQNFEIEIKARDKTIALLNLISENTQNCSLDFVIDLINFELANLTINQTPLEFNKVFVGDICDSLFEKRKISFFLGQTSSAVFRTQAETSLITDFDILALRKISAVGPRTTEITCQKRFKTLFNFLQAGELVYMFYPKTTTSQKQMPSVLFKEIKSKCECINLDSHYSPLMLAVCAENAEDVLRILNSPSKIMATISLIQSGKETEELAKLLAKKYAKLSNKSEGDIAVDLKRISPSMIEKYYKCPKMFFYTYICPLEEIDDEKFNQMQVGNIFHYIASVILDEKHRNLSDAEIEKESGNLFDNYAEKNFQPFLNDEKFTLSRLKENIKNVCKLLARECRQSDFKPVELERKIYKENAFGNVAFAGIVDRLDKDDESGYLRVIDYKTGESDSSLISLMFGEKLQLPLYANFLGDKFASYIYADVKSQFQGKDSPIFKGLFIDDLTLAKKQDEGISAGKGKYVALTSKTDASGKTSLFPANQVLGENEMRLCKKYAFSLAKIAAQSIKDGQFQSSPLCTASGSPCQFCSFKLLCENATNRTIHKSDYKKEDLVNALKRGAGENED